MKTGSLTPKRQKKRILENVPLYFKRCNLDSKKSTFYDKGANASKSTSGCYHEREEILRTSIEFDPNDDLERMLLEELMEDENKSTQNIEDTSKKRKCYTKIKSLFTKKK